MTIERLTPGERQDALQVLRDARTLLTDPKAWTKRAMCRRREHGDVYNDPFDDTSLPGDQLCFCTAGALIRASCTRFGPWPDDDLGWNDKPVSADRDTRSLDAYETAVTILTPGGMSIVDFND